MYISFTNTFSLHNIVTVIDLELCNTKILFENRFFFSLCLFFPWIEIFFFAQFFSPLRETGKTEKIFGEKVVQKFLVAIFRRFYKFWGEKLKPELWKNCSVRAFLKFFALSEKHDQHSAETFFYCFEWWKWNHQRANERMSGTEWAIYRVKRKRNRRIYVPRKRGNAVSMLVFTI